MPEEVSEAVYDDYSLNMDQTPSPPSFLSQGKVLLLATFNCFCSLSSIVLFTYLW